MDPLTPPPQKKGISPLAWVGIGSGVTVWLGAVVYAVDFLFLRNVISKVPDWPSEKSAEEMQSNPTRTMANTMVTVGAGLLEMVAEDDANKRYTLREKRSRKLTTVYWNPRINGPAVIDGDFSAIPAEANSPPPPVVVPEPK